MSRTKKISPRREFLGNVAAGAAALGLLSIPSSLKAAPALFQDPVSDADEWFKKVKGKHKIIFDVTKPNDLMPFAWPKVFLLTNEKTGTPIKENSVVVVLRHDGIPYAFEDSLWSKYKFGELFKANDPATKAASIRNPFWKPKPGDFSIPGIGSVEIGINELQEDGVMFCVCDMAITVFSAVVAKNMNLNAAEVKKEWLAGLLPGIQVVPSGVWAVGRAQEHGCAYCFAG
ncbi:MAG: twin-arginine translocation signal domain-containing protein [Ginsengibacter sp.]